MLKGFPTDKINVTKNALLFFSRAPTHSSFSFDSQLLYSLKHKVHFSKAVCGIFPFSVLSPFFIVYIFVQQKVFTTWIQNVIILCKIKIIEKWHTLLFPDLWFLRCNKKFENSVISAWVGPPQKLTWRPTF